MKTSSNIGIGSAVDVGEDSNMVDASGMQNKE
jgi:hypothetical protein